MSRHHHGLAAALLLAVAGSTVAGPDPARALADRIDKHIRTGWNKAKIQPAPLSDDAEFLRRVSLQLAGRIPPVAEVRAFLADASPDKRERLVRDLLDNARYVSHHVAVWRSWLMPEADASLQARFLVPTFDAWLRNKLRDNVGYDKMVRELLTASVDNSRGAFFGVRGGGSATPSPAPYFVGKELKAENIGAATARVFLGIRLECAQCHNHPFAEWKKEQFWSYAAFFSGIRAQQQGDFIAPQGDQADRRRIAIAGTDKTVEARFPDGTEPNWQNKEPTRKVLADWVTSPKNPYFARATVNRLWDHFFGLGLIDPVDEMAGTEVTASHPELLDELAQAFVDSKFDLKFLMRAITYSRTYQLSSRKVTAGKAETSLFARYPLRGLTAEQIYDSVAMATGHNEPGSNLPGVVIGGPRSPRQEFVSRFNEQSARATEFQTSILQALALMNGKLIEDATSLDRSEMLLGVVEFPSSLRQRIETLYLASLTRLPTDKELARMTKFVEESVSKAPNSDKARKEALADVFWTLLNSSEFILNH